MKNSKFMTLALVIIIATMSVFFIACPPADNGGTDGDTVTTLFSETATKVAAVDLYIRGNLTDWAVSADPTADQQFSEYSDGSYRATVDFAFYNGRPRIKFYHGKNTGDTWTDTQTINGFDPANPSGDPETDLLSTYTDTPKENGYVIGKVKGGMSNMTIYQNGGKYTFRVANLVVPATLDDILTSTHADEYVLIDTVVVRAGTDILPTDIIHPTKGMKVGSNLLGDWDDGVNAKFISADPTGDATLQNDTAKTFTKTFTINNSAATTIAIGFLNPDWDYKWTGVTIWETTSDATKKLGVAVPLVPGAGANNSIILDAKTASEKIEFVVDYTNVKAPTLKVTRK